MMSLTALLAISVISALASPTAWDVTSQKPLASTEPIRVPVSLGVSSQGSNSLVVENIFDQVLHKVGSKVDLRLIYTGELDINEPDFGVSCTNGPTECAGNVQQLCAEKYLDESVWWAFIHCQNFQGVSQIGTPEVAYKCAKAARFDWETSGVGQCAGLDASGTATEGVRLLQGSVALSKAIGINKPCTVHINAEETCRRQDGRWQNCDDGHSVVAFVQTINEAYSQLNNN